jgi:hypothetical protein
MILSKEIPRQAYHKVCTVTPHAWSKWSISAIPCTGAVYRENAEADRLADEARGEPCVPALTHESAYTFWRDLADENAQRFEGPLWHVSGDLRSSLKKAERSILLKDWQNGTTAQGDIVRAAGPGGRPARHGAQNERPWALHLSG